MSFKLNSTAKEFKSVLNIHSEAILANEKIIEDQVLQMLKNKKNIEDQLIQISKNKNIFIKQIEDQLFQISKNRKNIENQFIEISNENIFKPILYKPIDKLLNKPLDKPIFEPIKISKKPRRRPFTEEKILEESDRTAKDVFNFLYDK